jgi:sugar (pentulose or hexulose) kinase
LPTIVSLDIGTSKLCALALRVPACEPLAVCSIPNGADVACPAEGCHEQDPLRLRNRTFELLAQLLADSAVPRDDIAALSITGQMHGVLLVDPELRPLTNLITWQDRRVLQAGTPGCLDEARRAIDAPEPTRTGCQLHAGYGGATLFHLVRSGNAPSDATALSIADFLTASLTGVVAAEPTHAASWGLLDLRSRQWDSETIRRLGLPTAILPPLWPTSTPLAPIDPDLAGQLGLPTDTEVCSPIGDNQASVVGAAGLDGRAAVVNLGTGGQVSIPQAEPVWLDGFETRPMPFSGYILVGASLCGGWSYAYLRRFIQDTVRQCAGVELDDHSVYEQMNRLAADAPAGAAGLIVEPYFNGTRTEPALRGAVRGIDAGNFTPGSLSRAFVEGMVRELADLFHAADTARIAEIAASGNAVRKNPLVAETIEALFGRKCRTSEHHEEAAVGAALAAAATTCPRALLPRSPLSR